MKCADIASANRSQVRSRAKAPEDGDLWRIVAVARGLENIAFEPQLPNAAARVVGGPLPSTDTEKLDAVVAALEGGSAKSAAPEIASCAGRRGVGSPGCCSMTSSRQMIV
jgi:hypothetical protein